MMEYSWNVFQLFNRMRNLDKNSIAVPHNKWGTSEKMPRCFAPRTNNICSFAAIGAAR